MDITFGGNVFHLKDEEKRELLFEVVLILKLKKIDLSYNKTAVFTISKSVRFSLCFLKNRERSISSTLACNIPNLLCGTWLQSCSF